MAKKKTEETAATAPIFLDDTKVEIRRGLLATITSNLAASKATLEAEMLHNPAFRSNPELAEQAREGLDAALSECEEILGHSAMDLARQAMDAAGV